MREAMAPWDTDAPEKRGECAREFAWLLTGLVDHLARQGEIPKLARRAKPAPRALPEAVATH